MPSPFPGMDPFIEHPEIWNDFHSDLAAEIRSGLNRLIQPRYVARLAPRVTYELVEIEKPRSVRPDVGVWRPLGGPEEGGVQTAVLAPAPVQSQVAMEAPLR